jgi:hypothetical protein
MLTMQGSVVNNDFKTVVDITKGIAETLAYVLAGGFFLFKWTSGYQTTNLSLEIKCARQADPTSHSNREQLGITVVLTKGDRGSVHIFTVDVSVGGMRYRLMGGLDHYRVQKANARERTIDFEEKDLRYVSFLNPGERTEIATACSVASGSICDIQVVVVGRRKWSRRLKQWRASAVSLPLV